MNNYTFSCLWEQRILRTTGHTSHFPWGLPSAEHQVHSLTEERPTLISVEERSSKTPAPKDVGAHSEATRSSERLE